MRFEDIGKTRDYDYSLTANPTRKRAGMMTMRALMLWLMCCPKGLIQ
ncbi:hypothetical protein ACFLXT_03480 [Chloroflexota bacterium]